MKAEFCVEVIKYYAYSGNEKAQFTLDEFAITGFNSWVQNITGWQNPITRSQPPQPEQPAPALAAALPPAPGWSPENWELLPPEDQRYFAESPEQRSQRISSERKDLVKFLSTADV